MFSKKITALAIGLFLTVVVVLSIYFLFWSFMAKRQLVKELADMEVLISYDRFRPSSNELAEWLDRDNYRERVRKLARENSGKSSLDAWTVLLAAGDSVAVADIEQRFAELKRCGGDTLKPMGLYDYSMMLVAARNPDTKHILWDLILDPATPWRSYRQATTMVPVLSNNEDIPKLIDALILRVKNDPSYIRLLREAAEEITHLSFSGTTEEEADASFLNWLKTQASNSMRNELSRLILEGVDKEPGSAPSTEIE